MFEESGIDKSKDSIITEMFKEEIISESEFDSLIAQNSDSDSQLNDYHPMEVDDQATDYNNELEKVDKGVTKMKLETIEEEPCNRYSDKEDQDIEMDATLNNEVRRLVKLIHEQNMGRMLKWLQRILLDLCNAKYQLKKKSDVEKLLLHTNVKNTIEPIAFHSICKSLIDVTEKYVFLLIIQISFSYESIDSTCTMEHFGIYRCP